MTGDQFSPPTPGPPPRDSYKRPLVVPPGGGKPVPYTRWTTLAGAMEDLNNIRAWDQRMVALGLAERSDLVLAVAAHRDDKDELNRICRDAKERGGANTASGIGTSEHKLLERLDLGQDLGAVPDEYTADIRAYEKATAELEPIAIERFVVHDKLRTAGTPDRIVVYRGRNYVADIKTGKSIAYGAGKIACQMGGYSRSVFYDHATGTRTDLPDVDLSWALVIHVPAGSGTCQLQWVDIARGWADIELAVQVRAHRARKDWYTPFSAETPTNGVADVIGRAASVDELTEIWRARRDEWSDELTALAAARKEQLRGSTR